MSSPTLTHCKCGHMFFFIRGAVTECPHCHCEYKSYRDRVEEKDYRVCDEDCNNCPIINHPNSRMLTKILNKLQDKFGDGVYKIVQENCCNFTVCFDCHIDDFTHCEGCRLIDGEGDYNGI